MSPYRFLSVIYQEVFGSLPKRVIVIEDVDEKGHLRGRNYYLIAHDSNKSTYLGDNLNEAAIRIRGLTQRGLFDEC